MERSLRKPGENLERTRRELEEKILERT